MGQILIKYYKYVADEKGMMGQLELAKKTKIPLIQAGTAPDEKATIEAFKNAIKEITQKNAPDFS